MAIRVQNWKVAFMEQHTEVDPKTPAELARQLH